MKKIFLLFALMGIVAIGCSKEDIDKGNENAIFFGLDKESVTISPDGGSVDIVVYSNYKWEISGTSDWCTPSVTTGDANEDGQKVTFTADVTYDDREATFWFRCADEKIKLVVLQKLKTVIIPDANNTFDIPAEGGIAAISYKTNVDCEVVIPEDAQDWITIVPATRGLVTYNTTLNIAANNSGKQRRSVIKVISKDNNELFTEYTITQKLRHCLCYTSSKGKIVSPYETSSFDATILSNTYEDGVGVICFDAPITTIGNYAFYGCSSLTSVTIPDSVNSIRNSAFEDCSSLTSITIGDSVTSIGSNAFEDCSSLTSITIPNSVTSIGAYAFYDCSSLQKFNGKFASTDGRCLIMEGVLNFFAPAGITEYTIPNSVTSIGAYAFDCSSLTSVTIGDSVNSIGYSAFNDCSSLTSVTIGDSVNSIGYYAFNGCSSLTSVTIGDSVTSIGDWAFEDCSSLTSITIPNSVTTIGRSAFYFCSSLTSITIPNSVTTIGQSAFYFCSSLTSVTIGHSVTSIGFRAFYGCSSLKSVTIGDSVTTIGDSAFYGCSSLTSITIPDSVTSIGGWAFYCCSSLTSITIPDSVTSIGDWAFYDCSSLTSITIPDSVTSIGSGAFEDCSSLTSITIPDSVTSIGSGAFEDCSSLKSMYCKPITPPAGGGDMFDNNAYGRKIYVPMESVSEYQSASYWNDYASAIVGYNF